MSKLFRWLLVAAVAGAGSFAGVARADVTNSDGTNIQDGDASASATQGGSSGSGDAVGGQVSGIVSSGDTTVDAKNRTTDADVTSGEAAASNTGAAFAGLSEDNGATVDATDVTNSPGAVNIQDGDDDVELVQTANASSGDGVAGQVIGAVTSAGGSSTIVADNASEDVDATTGASFADNTHAAFVGLLNCDDSDLVITSDVIDSSGCNVQDGDNSVSATQTADSTSGDGVAGQVIGTVSAGDTSVDAKNRSTDVDADTGVADSENHASGFAGLFSCGNGNDAILTSDVIRSGACEDQDGDNDLTSAQTAAADTGDAVGGQVIGGVTSAGGSADIVADNASEDVDLETGEADASNEESGYVGLDGCDFNDLILTSDLVDNGSPCDGQDGDNSIDATQDASASSGDGVGGQVIGAVSAGDTSVDAKNRSTDVDVDTGLADASNEASQFAGLRSCGGSDDAVLTSDIINSDGCNEQDGDNDLTSDQGATATTGDGVGGQVIGSVTPAGGSADIVADNASDDVDVTTGEADATNEASRFVGSDSCGGDNDVVLSSDLIDSSTCNGQDGDNSIDATQTATASSGDGVAGEVIGVVSAGDTSVDAKNRSSDADVDTGLADASNEASQFAGLESCGGDNDVTETSDLIRSPACEAQDGDNSITSDQTAGATTGDGVAGQVIGGVTSAGGSADIVADNASDDVDVETGEADASNEASQFAGLNGCGGDNDLVITSDLIDSGACDGQDGDNSIDATQAATATSGDGVAGEVIGAVSAGDTSIDAKNRSTDVDVETGLADASNEASQFAGLFSCGGDNDGVLTSDITGENYCEGLDGNNEVSSDQTADATSGDGVGGQVIGAVTSAGGSADIVADNASEDIDIATGEADASNEQSVRVGLDGCGDTNDLTLTADIIDASSSCDLQDGDNSLDGSQTATASSGDGVGGQVLGAVSAGDTSIDAKNRSTDVDIDTGVADASNEASEFVGLRSCPGGDTTLTADVVDSAACNVQDGDNDLSSDQTATASTGDGVGGQVIGAVTSSGGSADIVADNASEDVDVNTGEATSNNSLSVFVGLLDGASLDVGGSDVIDSGGQPFSANIQDGDNSLDATQTADASSGDGVGGMVLGVVSAGDTSVDAENRSTDVDLDSGNATATDEAHVVVGLADADDVTVADVVRSSADNVQDGDNDSSLDQTASAASGDAVGGLVGGAVVTAGGSADAVLDNTSDDVDASTGEVTFDTVDNLFVGLNLVSGELVVG